MIIQSIIEHKILSSAAAFLFTLANILHEHFDGGVISHNFLAREDLPEISNWWGLLSIPILTWVTLFLVQRREGKVRLSSARVDNSKSRNVLQSFIGAFCFGLLISLLWEFELESILPYAILLPIVLSIFIPVHMPECLLGFVLAMMYRFGGVLPIIIGSVFLILSFIVNRVIRKGIINLVFILSKN